MSKSAIYFRDGKLVAKSGETRVYEMNGELFMETGRSNLVSSDQDLSDYIWQIGNKPSGDCLIIGLGLGISTKYVLSLSKVTSITILEPDSTIIDTQAYVASIENSKVNIINKEILPYLYQSDNKYDFIFVDCYNKIDEDTLPYIADIVAAAKKILTQRGVLLGWLDNNTPERFIESFYKIFMMY